MSTTKRIFMGVLMIGGPTLTAFSPDPIIRWCGLLVMLWAILDKVDPEKPRG